MFLVSYVLRLKRERSKRNCIALSSVNLLPSKGENLWDRQKRGEAEMLMPCRHILTCSIER